jgi:hypothetical protein
MDDTAEHLVRNVLPAVPDGVFDLAGGGPAPFIAFAPPRDEELTAILARIVRRTAKALRSAFLEGFSLHGTRTPRGPSPHRAVRRRDETPISNPLASTASPGPIS